MKKILHITDMQNDFVLNTGKLSVNAEHLILPANKFLADKAGLFNKTIATSDIHFESTYYNSPEGKLYPIHCVYGTRGYELAIKIGKYQDVLKTTNDIWDDPIAMDKALKGYLPKDTMIYLFGVASDICVKMAIAGYLNRGYNVNVIGDLCKGLNKEIDQVVAEFNNKKLNLITTKDFYNGK